MYTYYTTLKINGHIAHRYVDAENKTLAKIEIKNTENGNPTILKMHKLSKKEAETLEQYAWLILHSDIGNKAYDMLLEKTEKGLAYRN